jgi:UrcA family protein
MTTVRRPVGALGLFALLSLGIAAPALADNDLVVSHHPESGSITRSMRVDISDLRLTSAEGRSTLDRRITSAAKKVCAYNSGEGLRQPADYVRCFDKAKADALSSAPAIQTAMR